ncbi:hypothetical protein GCM10010331_38640 [Streptomyces xanthochromogenes]|nr:hypothetical protein GCM10010331_38640 [Streptomyces xanthochromogenes]
MLVADATEQTAQLGRRGAEVGQGRVGIRLAAHAGETARGPGTHRERRRGSAIPGEEGLPIR